MPLRRFVYYSAILGGWAAFLGWAMTAGLPKVDAAALAIVRNCLIVGVVGAMIGGSAASVAALTNPQWRQVLRHLPIGLVGGGFGGALGSLVGEFAYSSLYLPRAAGWTIMGLAIGAAQGLFDNSRRKLRNGLIGGGLGGLVGGVLFDPVASLLGSEAALAAQATGFTILGLSIGGLLAAAQVVLREAWLTVMEGFMPGRELILTSNTTMLGRGDHLPMPLLGYAARDLEAEHARIVRQPDGQYTLEDNRSRIGTLLNGRPVQGPTPLGDGDLIKLGGNCIRFRLRQRTAMAGAAAAVTPAPSPPSPPGFAAAGTAGAARPGMPPPPPPPPGGRPAQPAGVAPVGTASPVPGAPLPKPPGAIPPPPPGPPPVPVPGPRPGPSPTPGGRIPPPPPPPPKPMR